jgi:hypothetical protein
LLKRLTGYLWLGTDFSLLRVNGVRNVPWQPQQMNISPADRFEACSPRATGAVALAPMKGLDVGRAAKLMQ